MDSTSKEWAYAITEAHERQSFIGILIPRDALQRSTVRLQACLATSTYAYLIDRTKIHDPHVLCDHVLYVLRLRSTSDSFESLDSIFKTAVHDVKRCIRNFFPHMIDCAESEDELLSKLMEDVSSAY